MRWKPHTNEFQLAVRASMAAAVSLGLAQLLRLEYPIYSFLAAVIVTDLSPAQSRRLGWRRLVATVVGAACGVALSLVFPAGPLGVGFGVLIAMLACDLVRMQEGARVAGYTCGLILFAYGVEPWSYAYYRFVETVLGIAVAWSISLLPKLIRNDESERESA